jgi:hypothetical protein
VYSVSEFIGVAVSCHIGRTGQKTYEIYRTIIKKELTILTHALTDLGDEI